MRKKILTLGLVLAILLGQASSSLSMARQGRPENQDQKARMAEILEETEETFLRGRAQYTNEDILTLVQRGFARSSLKDKAYDDTKYSLTLNVTFARNVLTALALGEDPNQLFGKENLHILEKEGLKGAYTEGQIFTVARALILAEKKDQVDSLLLKKKIKSLDKMTEEKCLGFLTLALYNPQDPDLEIYKKEIIENMKESGVLGNLDTTARAIQALYAMKEDPYQMKNPQGKSLVDGLESLYRGGGHFASRENLPCGQEKSSPYYALGDLVAYSSAYLDLLEKQGYRKTQTSERASRTPAKVILSFPKSQKKIPLKPGDRQKISAKVYNSQGERLAYEKVTYTSSNPKVLKYLYLDTFQARPVKENTWVTVRAKSEKNPKILGSLRVCVAGEK